MKTLGGLVFAIAAMTIPAHAQCVGGDLGSYYVVCPPLTPPPMPMYDERPKQHREKAHHPAPAQARHPAPVHHVDRRSEPQHRDEDEKAPPMAPPPALPPR